MSRGTDGAPTETYLEVDADWRITATDGLDGSILPFGGADPVGEPLWAAVPAIEDTAIEDALRGAMRSRDPVVESAAVPDCDAGVEVRATPVDDGLGVFVSRGRGEAAVRTMRTLYDVTTDPDVCFEDTVDRTLELGCDHLGLPYGFLSNIEGAIVQACGDHESLQPGEPCPFTEACRRTVETDGLLAVHDAVETGPTADPAANVVDLGAYIGGTVVVEDDLYGTFGFAATEPRAEPFTAVDRMLVRVMSKWMGEELTRRRSNEELRRTNERLERFASTVSHDLRNPLTVAKTRLDLVRERHDGRYVEEAVEALQRMETLIEEALVLAREGEAATDPQPVELEAAARDAFDTVDAAHATLSVDADAVRADPDRLARLLENLIGNAVEHGGSDVTITVGDLPDGFYVADDGRGIPDRDREEVFERGVTTAATGTGLGLAIVREIAAAHGWDVSATESEDGGARLEITGVERP